ncbi:MAG: hypothetical protein HFJ17_01675 [Clostridia bacterium]|nr:hypothetical protein [Clostridia bacterium]
MSINTDLKREGIEVLYQLDKNTVKSIIKNISHKLVETFPEFYLDEKNLLTEFSKLNMYKAKMKEGMAEANYFYKNTSIYFNEHIEDEDLEEFAVHECLHYFQEVKDGNKLIRMGLNGLGLNEAAVQYMACKIIGIVPDFEKYYGITINTPSPSYYPLECALLNELIYFTGEKTLFKSTLFSTDDFENKIIECTSLKVYNKIKISFNHILKLEENIINLNNKISALPDGDTKFSALSERSNKYKDKIATIFINTQNLIIENFFNSEFNKIVNLEDLDNFRRKLDKFRSLVGIIDNYTFFDNYYIETMNKLEHKCNILENGGIETALENKHTNTFVNIIRKIQKLFSNHNRNRNIDEL